MNWVMAILSVLSFVAGVYIAGRSTSTLHEILAANMFVIWAILLHGSCVSSEMILIRRKLDQWEKERNPGQK